MYLKNLNGEVLFEGYFHSVKAALEAAILENINLEAVNLRGANLKGAMMDGGHLSKACLWGADLEGANMSEINLQKADCRNVNFSNACLADADCSYANFHGSHFANIILTNSIFKGAKFSCPSLFNNDLFQAKTMEKAIYSHEGETDCDLTQTPIIIFGLPQRVVLLENFMMIGHNLYNLGLYTEMETHFSSLIKSSKMMQLQPFNIADSQYAK